MSEMLFIIDMQNDYVDNEKGKLSVLNATTIVPKILQETKKQEEQGEPVYYTLDQHVLSIKINARKKKNNGE